MPPRHYDVTDEEGTLLASDLMCRSRARSIVRNIFLCCSVHSFGHVLTQKSKSCETAGFYLVFTRDLHEVAASFVLVPVRTTPRFLINNEVSLVSKNLRYIQGKPLHLPPPPQVVKMPRCFQFYTRHRGLHKE